MKYIVGLFLLLIPTMLEAACPDGVAAHAGNECIVSTTGSGSACTTASPCSLTFAIGASTIAVGDDEIWLKGGTYVGRFISHVNLNGTAGHQIIIRSHCGSDGICNGVGFADDERATLDSYQQVTLNNTLISTTVVGAVGTATCSTSNITLADATGFANGQAIFIGAEELTLTTLVGNVITSCVRGSPVTHPGGTGVGIGCTSVNIQLSSLTGIGTGEVLQLGDPPTGERISIVAKSGNNVTNCVRALDGTDISTHTTPMSVDVQGLTLSDFSEFTTWRDLEIMNSYPVRVFASGDAGDSTSKRGAGIHVFTSTGGGSGSLNEYVNLVVHDNKNGFFNASNSQNVTIYGSLCFNNGLKNTDANGLCGYLENTQPYDKLIYDNIMWNNTSGNIKFYSEQSGNVDRFDARRNLSFDPSGAVAQLTPRPFGFSTATTRGVHYQIGGGGLPNLRHNAYIGNVGYMPLDSLCAYTGGLWLGYNLTPTDPSAPVAEDLTVTNNYIVSCKSVEISNFQKDITFSGNTFVMPLTGVSTSANLFTVTPLAPWTGISIDGDSIYDRRSTNSSAQDGIKRYSFSIGTNTVITGCCHAADGGGGAGGASQLAWRDRGTLASAIDASSNCASVNFTVNDGSIFSTSPTASIQVDSEEILVTARSGDTITGCTRAQGGTSAAAHTNGTGFGVIYTAGAKTPTCTDGSCNTPPGTGFAEWLQGVELNATYVGGSLPVANVKVLYANSYETGRANAYIINWEGSASVDLDLTSGTGLVQGDTWALWDAENWTTWSTGTAIATGTYCSGVTTTATVPMSSLSTTVAPIGFGVTAPHTANAGAVGGAFVGVIRKTGIGTCSAGGGGTRILWIAAAMLIGVSLPVMYRINTLHRQVVGSRASISAPHAVIQPMPEREKIYVKSNPERKQ